MLADGPSAQASGGLQLRDPVEERLQVPEALRLRAGQTRWVPDYDEGSPGSDSGVYEFDRSRIEARVVIRNAGDPAAALDPA